MDLNVSSPDEGEGTTVLSSKDVVKLADASDRAHYLVIVRGEEKGRRIEITQKPIVLGRHETASVCLPDSRISKKHCQVQLSIQGDVVLTDLNSTNGTYIDGERVRGSTILPMESMLQIGQHMLKHEYRLRSESQASDQLAEDLKRAIDYVMSILPPPYQDENLEIDWSFVPSAHLGGDALGYHPIDRNHYAFYLLDVCGHGASAALHSVSAINVLRHQSLVQTDFAHPGTVLGELNKMFQMDKHGNMFFTIWFGVYKREERKLIYASAGHPPAQLVSPTTGARQGLKTRGLPIGSMPGASYQPQVVDVEPGSVLYVFSDGVFETVTRDGEDWTLGEFCQILEAGDEYRGRYVRHVCDKAVQITGSEKREDDFSLMAVKFL